MEPANSLLSVFLVRSREAAGLTLEDASKKMGTSADLINQAEKRPLQVPANLLFRIVKAYRASELDFQMAILNAQRLLKTKN